MAMQWTTKKSIILAVVVGLFGLGYVAWLTFFFRITAITPGGKTLGTLTPYIDINFNKKLGNNTTAQIQTTAGLVKKVEFNEKRIRIVFKKLEIDKQYTITLSNITSESGDIVSVTHAFTVKETEFEKLPKDQQKVLLDVQDTERAAADPILANVPYGGEHFSLSVSPTNNDGDSSVHLTAELLLSRSDLDDRDTAITAYKAEVAEYIQSIGLRIADYNITYEVVEPSIY